MELYSGSWGMAMSFNPVFVVSSAKKPDWYYAMAQFAHPDPRKSI